MLASAANLLRSASAPRFFSSAPVTGLSRLHLQQQRLYAAGTAVGVVTPKVTVAHGDGIGPEIMQATLRVLQAAGANLEYETIDIGEQLYLKGETSGISAAGWDSLNRTKTFLKAPISTPLGGGVKSLNVTVRKTLGLYSNVRPVISYSPYVPALHKKLDMVIIRENEEDLYAGIEHRHTAEVLQCIKLITIPGSVRICRYALDYAREHGRKKVTCVTKNNIMKLTDGAFANVFKELAAQYPDLQTEHRIVDIATAQVAAHPEQFDVLVTLNLYGDIISDVAAEVAGSVGLAGSANIGDHAAMFEAVHGSAPDIAGKDIANPSGLINAAVMMLGHFGQHQTAAAIKNALLVTLEDGIHTADIYRKESQFSKKRVGTAEFTDALIARLGKSPKVLPVETVRTDVPLPDDHPKFEIPQQPVIAQPVDKQFVGVDIFIDWEKGQRDPNALAAELNAAAGEFKLQMISNRGVKVWPNPHPDTYKVDHWRCRFFATSDCVSAIPALMMRLHKNNIEVIKTENLYNFDGKAGYSLGQGQ